MLWLSLFALQLITIYNKTVSKASYLADTAQHASWVVCRLCS